MARLSRGGVLKSKEAIQVTIVTPAEGPSFFVAPSGKCICKEIYSKYLAFYKVVSC